MTFMPNLRPDRERHGIELMSAEGIALCAASFGLASDFKRYFFLFKFEFGSVEMRFDFSDDEVGMLYRCNGELERELHPYDPRENFVANLFGTMERAVQILIEKDAYALLSMDA